MAFQIKNFSSIVASLINYMRGTTAQVTDFNVGSVARSLIEAPAAEMEELYLQYFHGLKEAIPVSMYVSLGFDALLAKSASNLIRVVLASSTSPILIPAGTAFASVGLSTDYLSITDITVAPGNTFVDVTVAARTAGVVGNIAAGLAFTLAPAPAGFVSASNQSTFTNGADEESEGDRKVRFASYIRSLPRGTPAALLYALKTTNLLDAGGNEIERVQNAAVIEPYVTDATQPIGLVQLYIHNGVGGTSSALLNRAREVIYGYYVAGVAVPGWKAAGVRVDIFTAIEVLVPVTGTLSVLPGFDPVATSAAVNSTLFSYIQSLDIGVTAIRAELIAAAMNIDGVSNFVISTPAADIPASTKTKLMPGAITLTLQ